MVDWTRGSGRRSGILKTKAFSAFAIRLGASLVTESKRRPVAARLLTLASLEGSIGLANGDSFGGKSSIC